MGWGEPSAKAQKILGPKGKIPKPEKVIVDAPGHLAGLYTNCKTAQRALDAAFKALRDAEAAYHDSVQQFSAVVAKDHLGLDPKNDADAKKIKQAAAILTGWLGEQQAAAERDATTFDNVQDHLAAIGKFKGPTAAG